MRDQTRQHRFNNSYTVSYPDFPSLTNVVRSVVITKEMGKHDIVEILYPVFSSVFFKAIKTGVPVEITWRNEKVTEKFIGYTVDVSHLVSQQFDTSVTVTCVGASYPLKERASKIWTNKSASDIAIEIAKKFKLKPVVTASNLRFAQQSLAGHSYWEKLNELAERIGYGIQVMGTEMHFHPIDKMINQFMTVIPIMSFQDPLQNVDSNIIAPTLSSFDVTVGDHIESNKYSRSTNTVGGVDPVNGKTYSFKSSSNKVGKNLRKDTRDPLFSSIETTVVAGNSTMAKSLSEARAHLGRFSISAQGVGQGDPRIAPWRTLEVKGTGITGDGFWVVKKARHVIQGDGRYVVEFTCISDGTGGNKASAFRPSFAGLVPTRDIANEITSSGQNKPTLSKLSSAKAMIKQNNAGYSISPRRWGAN